MKNKLGIVSTILMLAAAVINMIKNKIDDKLLDQHIEEKVKEVLNDRNGSV